MDVGVTELRTHLGDWLDLVRGGDAVVITDRGVPVARLVGLDSTNAIERLTSEGMLSRPGPAGRVKAAGRRRPRSKGSVADLVSKQRASR